MKLKARLRILWKHLKGHTDPVNSCLVFKERGCAHVDGLLCNFPNCKTFKSYYRAKIRGEHWGSCGDCRNNEPCNLPGYGLGCDTHYKSINDTD